MDKPDDRLKASLRFFLIVVVSLTIVLVAFPLWQRLSQKAAPRGFALGDVRFVEYDGGQPTVFPYKAGDDVLLNFNLENVPLGDQGRSDAVITFQALDPGGRPLKAPTQSKVSGTVSRVPVSYGLTLPLYALGGTHKIRIDVEDRVGGTRLQKDADFQVIGPAVADGASLGLQDHVFVEAEGGPPMAEPAYRAGMKIRSGFNVVGFRLGPNNRITLRVDLGILNEAGEVLLDQPDVVAIDQDLFYPARYLPVTTSVRSPEDMPAGTYRMRYTLRDGVSGQALSLEQPFMIR